MNKDIQFLKELQAIMKHEGEHDYDIYMDVHCIGWIPGGYELEVIGNIYESLDLIKK
ncbi:hypothetical protein [Bacillus wiedmannii]|uniref:hypothetical protein n=1 Tax=Bacillus wiedmannii TaxID=1890302 RepID=UPI0001A02B38|nr:hypothetical protein [Bacillus wiedmannii]EEK64377.1 hypothetical protein bcere0006_55150 [Bacillus wiedmannii]